MSREGLPLLVTTGCTVTVVGSFILHTSSEAMILTHCITYIHTYYYLPFTFPRGYSDSPGVATYLCINSECFIEFLYDKENQFIKNTNCHTCPTWIFLITQVNLLFSKFTVIINSNHI
jgi:hypothetical protein